MIKDVEVGLLVVQRKKIRNDTRIKFNKYLQFKIKFLSRCIYIRFVI